MGHEISPTSKRLTKALDSLPAKLRYLRPAIVSLAMQNEDSLGSGDGDYSVFEAAWKIRRGNLDEASSVDLASADAAALEEWAEGFGSRPPKYLAPVWSLIGFFQGVAFPMGAPPSPANDQSEEERFVDLVVPREMKVLWSPENERVMQDEANWIVVQCIDEVTFGQVKAEMLKRAEADSGAVPAPARQTERIRRECDPAFSRGNASGLKYVEWRDGTDRAKACRYFLAVPGGHVQVFMAERNERGFEIANYEALIETIRVRRQSGRSSRAPQHASTRLRVDIAVPKGMRANEAQYGWELKDRIVWIVVTRIELKDLEMRQKQELGNPMCRGICDRNSRISRCECMDRFERQSACGVKQVFWYAGCDLPCGARYVLSVPGGAVQVNMRPQKGDSFDIALYEPLIETIRVVPANASAN